MTHELRVRLWEAINAVVVASGGDPANVSVARQLAVVAVERVMEDVERAAAESPSRAKP